MFVLGPPTCNCYKLNRLHTIVAPPLNDKIDTMITDYFFVSFVRSFINLDQPIL